MVYTFTSMVFILRSYEWFKYYFVLGKLRIYAEMLLFRS